VGSPGVETGTPDGGPEGPVVVSKTFVVIVVEHVTVLPPPFSDPLHWSTVTGKASLVVPDADTSALSKRIITLGYTEPKFTAMVERVLAPGQVVADVGASMGYFTCLMAKSVGSTGRVIAFEPTPSTFAILETNARRSDP